MSWMPRSSEIDPGPPRFQSSEIDQRMSGERIERRLAAIMAIDVAAYSRLMEEDEEGTHERLRAHLTELVNPKLSLHRGRLVKNTGDGGLAEFSSVVDAVRCAVEIQRAMTDRNAKLSENKRIVFRIGINLGDVIVEPEDIYGEGVNIAARLEHIAEPGGICISDDAMRQVRGKVDIEFTDIGEQALKNITRPVRAFAARLGGEAAQVRSERPGLAPPEKPSLVVLPFQNMTGNSEEEYFVDGMVEEITTAIARLPWLFVIARNSSFTYKGRAVDVKQVARELGVRYVLEGSVRKAGQRVRITGQLIDTSSGAHIWADRFDGALDDIFELQDQVASSVAGAIEPKLKLAEIERANRKPTENLGAYDLYLRALAQLYRYTEESVAEAVIVARKALAIDPRCAPAAALIGWCYFLQRAQGWGAVPDEEIAAAVRLAGQALELAQADPEPMCYAAWLLFYFVGEPAMSETIVDQALALNPNSATAWLTKGSIYAIRNRPDEAIEALNRGLRLSPFDPLRHFYDVNFAIAHLAAGRFDQAIEWAERALQSQPRIIQAIRVKIVAYAHTDRLVEARRELTRMLALYPDLTISTWRTVAGPFAPELLELYVKGLRRAGLPEG
jgi:TolB-like protein